MKKLFRRIVVLLLCVTLLLGDDAMQVFAGEIDIVRESGAVIYEESFEDAKSDSEDKSILTCEEIELPTNEIELQEKDEQIDFYDEKEAMDEDYYLSVMSDGVDGNGNLYVSEDQAIQWLNDNLGRGFGTQYEGRYQCLGLIIAYMREACGAPGTSISGMYYASEMPGRDPSPGYDKIQGAQPKRGDILIYTAGYGGAGHVSIYGGPGKTYHQNVTGTDSTLCCLNWDYLYDSNLNYWGVWRPRFRAPAEQYIDKLPQENVVNIDARCVVEPRDTNGSCTIYKTAPVWSMPCSNKTDANSKQIYSATVGNRFRVTRKIKNTAGNTWYEVKTNNYTGYIFCENVTLLYGSSETSSAVKLLKIANGKTKIPLRDGYYKTTAARYIYADEQANIICAVGEVVNDYGNLWYKLSDGTYVYSENVQEYGSEEFTNGICSPNLCYIVGDDTNTVCVSGMSFPLLVNPSKSIIIDGTVNFMNTDGLQSTELQSVSEDEMCLSGSASDSTEVVISIYDKYKNIVKSKTIPATENIASFNNVSLGEFSCGDYYFSVEAKIKGQTISIVDVLFAISQGNEQYSFYDDSVNYIIEEGVLTKYIGTRSYLEVPEGVTKIADYCFYSNSNLQGIELPSTLKEIGKSAFEYCTNLNVLDIPESVTKIGPSAFSACHFDILFVPSYVEPNYFDYDTQHKYPVGGFSASTIEKIVFPANITSIPDAMFSGVRFKMKTLEIPDSVKSIGQEAFSADASDFTSLHTEVTSIKFPKNVESIGKGAFRYFRHLETLDIPKTISTIEEETFKGCGISELVIPSNIKEIKKDAFRGSNIKNIIFPESEIFLCDFAFANTKLETISLKKNIKTKFDGDSPYCSCNDVTSIVIEEGVTEIPAGYFSWSGIRNISIPKGVKTIGEKAFDGCTNLNTITMPDSVQIVDKNAFSGCTNLNTITMPDSVQIVDKNAFSDCESLTSISLPKNLLRIGDSCFSGCKALKSVTIPGTVNTIGSMAFTGCDKLEEVILEEGVKEIGDGAFSVYNDTLKKIVIPASVNKIGNIVATFINKNVAIYGERGSEAERYAKNNNIKFVATGGNSPSSEYSCSAIEPQEYAGGSIMPSPEIRDGELLMTKGTDYTVSYKNNTNVGTASVTITGKGNYSKSMTINFSITPKVIGTEDYSPTEGMVVAISDKQYTGKSVISKPTVKYGKLTLKENKDYTVSYSEDTVNPGIVDVTISAIEGNGKNYVGTIKTKYRIYGKSLDFSKVVINKLSSKTYTGREIALTGDELQVYADPKKTTLLTEFDEETREGDYKVEYQNNKNVGTATIIIKGAGVYADYGNSKSVTFKITPKALTQDMFDVANMVYTGAAVKPEVAMTDGGVPNYTVSYSNNTNVAAATDKKAPTATIKGKGNYTGTVNVPFNITPLELSDSELDIVIPDIKDNGKTIAASNIKPVVKYANPVTGKTVTLKSGTDYTVDFTRDTGSVVQTAKIVLKGNYKNDGDISEKFKIYAAQTVLNATDFFVLVDDTELVYTGGKLTPNVTVKEATASEEILKAGKDYTVSYSNNVNAADKNAPGANVKKLPTVKITGKGLYKGTLTQTFSIQPMTLSESDFDVVIGDVLCNPKKEQTPKVTVTNKATKKALKSADYTITVDGSTKTVSEAIDITISGKGNYDGPINKTFRVYGTDIGKMVFDKIENQAYKGSAIRPAGDAVKVYADKKKTVKLTEGTDYVLEYGENIKAGSGSVIVKGIGNYGGSKTVKFTIVPKWLQWLLL